MGIGLNVPAWSKRRDMNGEYSSCPFPKTKLLRPTQRVRHPERDAPDPISLGDPSRRPVLRLFGCQGGRRALQPILRPDGKLPLPAGGSHSAGG